MAPGGRGGGSGVELVHRLRDGGERCGGRVGVGVGGRAEERGLVEPVGGGGRRGDGRAAGGGEGGLPTQQAAAAKATLRAFLRGGCCLLDLSETTVQG